MLNGTTIRNYAVILSGSAGRLVLSLLYFVIVANGLSLQDFGIFATASAMGIVLSRVLAFGFISPLFRTATARHRLTGAYLAGFAALAIVSLPLIVAIGWGIHASLFARDISLSVFALIIMGEVLGWRLLEVVAIVNNGMKRYALAAQIVIIGSIIRTLAAILFWWIGKSALADWAWLFLAANLVAAALAAAIALPRMRWRWAPELYPRRMGDAISAGLADIAFYVQSELDKLLVLTLAGPKIAGLYAIAMRVIDLTAVPVRAFNQMMVQSVMIDQGRALASRRTLTEIGIAVVSVAGFAAIIIMLWLFPGMLGRNIQDAALLFPLLLLVPALRNLIEYHSELLYAQAQTLPRLAVLLLMAAMKAMLLWLVLRQFQVPQEIALWLNAVFAAMYLASAALTYSRVTSPVAQPPKA
jgi:O-antigen/teichoic acid export membrane protein